jgi:hypothetical protein
MAAATMASLPPPPTTMTAILTLIILALPPTRIRQQGGGRTMMLLIRCCHGCCCWRHLCLHSWDGGTKDNGRGDRQGRHANICGREEVEHHDPIGMEQQNQQQKQKQKQNQLPWQQRHCLCACRQLHPCSRRCCLWVSKGSRGNSTGVAVVDATSSSHQL